MKSYVDDVITIEDLRFWLLLGGTVAAYSLIRFAPRLIDLRGRFISPGELKAGSPGTASARTGPWSRPGNAEA